MVLDTKKYFSGLLTTDGYGVSFILDKYTLQTRTQPEQVTLRNIPENFNLVVADPGVTDIYTAVSPSRVKEPRRSKKKKKNSRGNKKKRRAKKKKQQK